MRLTRVVYTGHAFLKVMHDAARPFAVAVIDSDSGKVIRVLARFKTMKDAQAFRAQTDGNEDS